MLREICKNLRLTSNLRHVTYMLTGHVGFCTGMFLLRIKNKPTQQSP